MQAVANHPQLKCMTSYLFGPTSRRCRPWLRSSCRRTSRLECQSRHCPPAPRRGDFSSRKRQGSQVGGMAAHVVDNRVGDVTGAGHGTAARAEQRPHVRKVSQAVRRDAVAEEHHVRQGRGHGLTAAVPFGALALRGAVGAPRRRRRRRRRRGRRRGRRKQLVRVHDCQLDHAVALDRLLREDHRRPVLPLRGVQDDVCVPTRVADELLPRPSATIVGRQPQRNVDAPGVASRRRMSLRVERCVVRKQQRLLRWPCRDPALLRVARGRL